MPIRIPQYVSQQSPDLGGTPRLSPSDADLPGLRAASQAIVGVGETVTKGLSDYQKIQETLVKQDNALDVDMKLDELRDRLSKNKMAMVEEGIEPTELAQTYNQRGQTDIAELTGQLKYARGAPEFQQKANHLLTTGTIEQRGEALQRLNARVSLGNSLKMDDLSLDAVRAGAEAERQRDLAARYEREGEPELKQMALDAAAQADAARRGHLNEMKGILGTMTGTGVWGADKAEAETRKARTGILMGDLEAQFQNPSKATAIIGGLRRFEYPLAPEQQIKLADSLEQKERAETKRRKDEIKEAEKELAGTADKEMSTLTAAQRWPEARTVLANSMRIFDKEQVRHWTNVITNGEKGVKEDDRDTVLALQPKVYSVLSRVNPGQPKTDAEVYQEMAENDQALADGKLKPETHRLYANELQSRLNKAKEDPQLARRHAQAEQDMRTLITGGGLMPIMEGPMRAVLDTEMADLRRNSAFFGGKEDPFAWFDRRAPAVRARLSGVGSAYQGDLEKQMQLGDGRPYKVSGNEFADKQALQAQRGTFKREDDYLDQVRMLRDWYAVERARQQLQGTRQPLGGGARPSAPSPAPTPQGGGKSLGRPQGTP